MKSIRPLGAVVIVIMTLWSLVVNSQVMGQTTAQASQEWTQDAHDAQHTGYISEEPLEPWKLLWTWNGPDANGGTGNHFIDVPREARTVTGGQFIYAPAGTRGIFALYKTTGQQAWNVTATSFNAAPAYEPATGYLFANGGDGKLYKIDSRNGSVLATYNAGNPLNKSVVLVNGFAYIVTDNGQLHKVNTTNMTAAWVYSANAPIATPPAYSASRDVIVYATNDLYIHAVNNSNGSAKWRVKPTPNTAGFPNEMDGMWPVIAEQHGVVFVRMRLDHNAGLWGGPGPGGMYPTTNADTRAFLQSHPQLKNLFALNLDNGTESFIPAVGYGGPEALENNVPYLDVGPVPVIRTLSTGQEVAYMMFRSGQGNPPDGRWDSNMGEMVLDSTTVPGLVAGDLRFIAFPNSYLNITDEQDPFTLAGDTIFRAHWGASESTKITNRANTVGLTYANPITSKAHPVIIRRQQTCGDFNPSTHWTTCGLTLYQDGRYWGGPGWWIYWNTYDPPNGTVRTAYSDGRLPFYTYVSDGLVISEGGGGDLMVFKHSGTTGGGTVPPTSPTPPTPLPTASSTLRPTASSTPRPTASFTPTAVLSPTLVPTSLPPTQTGATTPLVTSLTTSSQQAARYQKFEVTFQISKTYPADSMLPYYFYDPSDPKGIDGITIDGHFIAPSGREIVVPSFYYQQYSGSGTKLVASNNFSWKLRFAPEETGVYAYYVTITDRNGSTRYPNIGVLPLQSVDSTSKGFVRVSSRDPRFLEFSNGESFVPVSSGHVFWEINKGRSLDFVNTFADFGRNGINLMRLWDQNDGYNLTVEGHFDGYNWPDDANPVDRGIDISKLPKGTQMNQRGNYEEDTIIEAAERNGVYIILSSHGDPYWIWDASIYQESWNTNPVAFDNPAHIRYWERNFRYRVARWGYSTSIMTWEVWNEHGHVPVGSNVYNFYQTYGQFQQQTDPYHHLRSTSQGSQAWSPGLWGSPAMDVASYHDYMMISRYSADLTYDAANFVYRFAQCLRTPGGAGCGLGIGDGSTWQGNNKPIYWGEIDTGTANWNEPNPQPKATHDMRWAGLFSPIGMSPIDWYFDHQSASFIATKYKEAKIASDFFKGIDYAGLRFTYLATNDVILTSEAITVDNPKLRVLAMRSSNGTQVYAWVQNKDNARWDQAVNTAPITASFSIKQVASGNYRIEIWDTYTGTVSDGGVVAVSNGVLTVPVKGLSKDVAIKIVPVNQPPSTPTLPTSTPIPTLKPPTATQVPPTSTATPIPTLKPPTATQVPPTSTPTPIPTLVPPTLTPVPPTAVPTQVIPSTPLPTIEPSAVPSGNPGVQVSVLPAAANPGETVVVTLNLHNVSNLFGLEAECLVDPAVLAGKTHSGGDGFNDSNSVWVDLGFQSSGSWQVAASRVRPNLPISGDTIAFSLNYIVQSSGSTPIICTILGVDENGRDVPLEITNAVYNGTGTLPPIEPTITTATPTLPPTLVPTPGTLSSISGVVNIPGATDHSGISIGLYANNTLLAQITTTSNGSYLFTDVPVGSYVLSLSAPQALLTVYNIDVTADGQVIDLGLEYLPMGDTDGNGQIDLLDAALVGANFGLDSSLVPNANFNRDTVINVRDLVQVGSSFGLVSPVVKK